jgi:hypothetical protein
MTEDFREATKKASKKFHEKGPFSMTAQDHKDLGSTPPKILKENPGKTIPDIYPNEKLEQDLQMWLNGWRKYVQPEYMNSASARSYSRMLSKRILASIRYLRSINRLPEQFKDFDKIK